jgi:hypothetical protein
MQTHKRSTANVGFQNRVTYIYNMKKIIAIAILAIVYSCSEEREILPINEISVDGYHTLKVVPFEGHDYLVLHRMHHGSTIIHSESCKCKNK